jgi:hypothetical protein
MTNAEANIGNKKYFLPTPICRSGFLFFGEGITKQQVAEYKHIKNTIFTGGFIYGEWKTDKVNILRNGPAMGTIFE